MMQRLGPRVRVREVHVLQEFRVMITFAWDNGADIDPDVLYYGLTPAWADGVETAVRS